VPNTLPDTTFGSVMLIPFASHSRESPEAGHSRESGNLLRKPLEVWCRRTGFPLSRE
jgi:hypothetical protein